MTGPVFVFDSAGFTFQDYMLYSIGTFGLGVLLVLFVLFAVWVITK